MEQNLNITEEKNDEVIKSIGGYDVTYKHNGAEVYMKIKHREESKYGYALDASVLVMKGDKSLVFVIGESIGNEKGTIFTKAMVRGLPTREDKNDDVALGMYPYDIFVKSDQDDNQDLLTRAAVIYSHYDRETNGDIKIGEVFKSYVPSTYKEIKKELETGNKNQKELTQVSMQQIRSFKDSLSNF